MGLIENGARCQVNEADLEFQRDLEEWSRVVATNNNQAQT